MSDFDRVASGYFGNGGGRVGAPWQGVGGPQVVFPSPGGNPALGSPQPAMETSQRGKPVMYMPQQYLFGGNSYLGLASTDPANNSIPTLDNRSFKVVPERPFKPLQFMAVSRVTGLLIENIKMNNTDYMSHPEGFGMPVELFSEISQAMGLNWDTINTSNGVSLRIFNTNATDQEFLAGFCGIQLQSS